MQPIATKEEARQECLALLDGIRADNWADLLPLYVRLGQYAHAHGHTSARPGSIHEALRAADWNTIAMRIGFAESEEEAKEIGGPFRFELRHKDDKVIWSNVYATAEEIVWDILATWECERNALGQPTAFEVLKFVGELAE